MALLPVNQTRDGPNPPDVGAIAQHCMFYPTSRVVLGDDSFFSSSDSLASFQTVLQPNPTTQESTGQSAFTSQG